MSSPRADISENYLLKTYPNVLDLLLIDKASGQNILWATDDYVSRGESYAEDIPISVESITGDNGDVIQPRTYKAQSEQSDRTKDKAEVFTPGWVVNLQNNAVDESWFGRKNVFNTVSEDGKTHTPTTGKIEFPCLASNLEEANDDSLRTWQSYVRENRMEITCGEAPYLVSRYDAVSGNSIPIAQRFGLLDRKLRVIEENVLQDHAHEKDEWMYWVKTAFQSVYGFEWQGDSLLRARENLLFTFFDVYRARYHADPSPDELLEIAEVISWNLFQMDGLKLVVPNSCHEEGGGVFEGSLFDDEVDSEPTECPGCAKGNNKLHNGIYSILMDWSGDEAKPMRFIDVVN